MKSLVLVLSLLVVRSASAVERTYLNYPELKTLIEVMSDSAAGGASLAFFGYTEGLPDSSVQIGCSKNPMTKNAVVKEFLYTADAMFEGGDPSMTEAEFKELKKKAAPQFRELIGKGPFKACGANVDGRMTMGEFSIFIGPEYVFSMEVGSED